VGQDLSQPYLLQPVLQPARPSDADLAALACDFDVFLEDILHCDCAMILNRGRPVSVEIHRDRDALVSKRLGQTWGTPLASTSESL
jgi:hypothetical protein